MLNYEVPPALLRPLVPSGTELDTWDGATVASMVGFRFLDTRVAGIPVPGHGDFDEVNLRFYVRRRVERGRLAAGRRVRARAGAAARRRIRGEMALQRAVHGGAHAP